MAFSRGEIPEDEETRGEEEPEVETFAFQEDIAQVVSLFNNTSYHNKEIFLKELIAFSSLGLANVRHESPTNPSCLESDDELFIKIILDKEARTLTILDTGIGMNKAELIKDLGNSAKKRARYFMESFEDGKVDISMAGEFSLSFYCAYLVADKVTVISKSDDDEEYMWESSADGSFTVRPSPEKPEGRRTKIVLHIKEDQTEFLEKEKIKEILKKHFRFFNYPIKLCVKKQRKKKLSKDRQEEENTGEEVQESNKKPDMTRNPDDSSQAEHGESYQSFTNDWDDYLEVKDSSKKGQPTFRVAERAPLHLGGAHSTFPKKRKKRILGKKFRNSITLQVIPEERETEEEEEEK